MNKKNQMPEIGLIGMSHKTAAVEVRENFSLDDDKFFEFIERAKSEGIEEIICISTCNRVEIYFTSADIGQSVDKLLTVFEKISTLQRSSFEDIIYKKYSIDAVIHLLTVTSSLDSMVVGENEILGQVKEAYRKSTENMKTGTILNRLFHQAFKTAKRVRTETEIARSPLSIAYIATELAKSIFEDLSQREALMIGAGEMGELILKYLTKYNIKKITIANRSFHNAEKIAREINTKARIITLEDIKDAAGEVDILISSVSSPDYIITNEIAKKALIARGNDPLFMIDIAVPRNIDPSIDNINNIFLYNIDDLRSIADENLKSRLKEVEIAKQLIESDAEEFYEWYEGLAVVPTIVKLQEKFDAIRKNELNRYKRRKLKHLSEEDYQIIENLTTQIMTKTLHDPIMFLKGYQNGGKKKKENIKETAKIIEELFGKLI